MSEFAAATRDSATLTESIDLDSQYIVGIDLGTTHCVMAYARTNVEDGGAPDIQIFRVPQVVGAGRVNAQPLLPSFLLLPAEHDVPPGSMSLPWRADMDYVVGAYCT